ncbi:MAG: trk system potassium uptake protein TrkH [Candidatus Poriferisodalaceae bacterium]|jgi:trk system potassium uptake protein TrkH
MTPNKPRQAGQNRKLRKIRSAPVRIAGAALIFVATGMLVSAIVGFIDGGGDGGALLWSAAITAATGSLFVLGSTGQGRADPAISFAAVAWSWVAASIAGAVPFLLTGAVSWRDADNALFESVSGFTCTGSTILPDIDSLPHGLLFFRQMTQWFGGMGLIVLAVAVLPALKVGGLELIDKEAPGPSTDRLTPRIRETAARLWQLYFGVTVAVTGALMLAGLSLYDAVGHAFATVATGGFSTRGSSAGAFDSVAVELVLIVGMIFCGASFTMHWQASRRGLSAYRVSEFSWYLSILGGGFALVVWLNVGELTMLNNLRESAFNVVTIVTSTGFGTSDFTGWSVAVQMVFLMMMIVGGMTGSTTGGIKVLRLQVVWRYAFREIIRSRHPRAVLPMRLGSTIVPEQIAARAVGFVLVYLGLIVVGGVVVTALGTDPVTAFSGAISAIGNDGPALGNAGPHSTFLAYPRPARPVLMGLMLAGRLEIFPTLLMFAASARYLGRSRLGVRSSPDPF